MPGFDGTGPRGEGPMTGGGRGFCNSNYAGRGRGMGRGWGRGIGRGQRRGIGRGWDSDERTYLADQLSALENEIREIKERLKALDRNDDKENG